MSVSLLTSKIWPTLSTAAKRSSRRAHVAVAYLGQGAAALLPLRNGSRIVVDASETAVKSGQTCPAELAKLIRRGVRVFSVPNLHAKVFVLGTKAFVGSANVSRHSADTLVEAMMVTGVPAAVASSRSFVSDLCRHELGPQAVARLSRLYRPPRRPGSRGPRRHPTKPREASEMPRMHLARLVREDPPTGSENAEAAGRTTARRRMVQPRRHELDHFWWNGRCAFQPGDVVTQVLDEGEGRRMVSPPGTVLHVRAWRKGPRATTFVYLEVPARKRVRLETLAQRLGRGAKKRLSRGGRVGRDFAERFLEIWSR